MAFSTHDIVPDSPTTNFCTMNPLQSSSTSNVTSEGNLRVSITSNASIRGNFYVSTRKWYCEVYVNTLQNLYLGLASNGGRPTSFANTEAFGVNNGGFIYQNNAYANLKSIALIGSSTFGIYFDADAKLFWISKNGQWYSCNSTTVSSITKTDVENGLYGYDFSGLLGDSYTLHFGNSTNAGADISVNTGQDPTFGGNKNTPATVNGVTGPFAPSGDAEGTAGLFHYPPPAGALALCTANLPDFTPTVADDTPQDYFKAVTYTGDGVDLPNGGQQITTGMQPDLVWIKQRNGGDQHCVFDSVRGPGMLLGTNTTGGDSGWQTHVNNGNYYFLHEFNATGFKVNRSAGSSTNESGSTFASWCWKAGGNSNTFNINGTGYSTYSALQTANISLPAITSGMIEPSGMSINTDAGFSIVKYTGIGGTPTIPHGLSSAPEFVIIKSLNDTNNWAVITPLAGSLSSGTYLFLNSANEAKTSTDFNAMAFNASTITLDTSTAVNSTFSYIMYCWHSVEGYSKFGSYTGNGSTSGNEPFVYTGFKPAWLMIKRSDTANDGWYIYDNARSSYNVVTGGIRANSPNQEDGTQTCDFLSNGFRIRIGANGNFNATNGTYIYMAFAEQPFKYANAR